MTGRKASSAARRRIAMARKPRRPGVSMEDVRAADASALRGEQSIVVLSEEQEGALYRSFPVPSERPLPAARRRRTAGKRAQWVCMLCEGRPERTGSPGQAHTHLLARHGVAGVVLAKTFGEIFDARSLEGHLRGIR